VSSCCGDGESSGGSSLTAICSVSSISSAFHLDLFYLFIYNTFCDEVEVITSNPNTFCTGKYCRINRAQIQVKSEVGHRIIDGNQCGLS